MMIMTKKVPSIRASSWFQKIPRSLVYDLLKHLSLHMHRPKRYVKA